MIACDIDPEAARVVPFFVGSVDAVRSASFDVVVANINEDVIGDLRPEFERVARQANPSGFQDEHGEWTCVMMFRNQVIFIRRSLRKNPLYPSIERLARLIGVQPTGA